MKIIATKPFKRDYKKILDEMKKRAQKTLKLLLNDHKHPLLNLKKTKGKLIKEHHNVFEARVNLDYRILLLITDNSYILLRIGKHDEFFR